MFDLKEGSYTNMHPFRWYSHTWNRRSGPNDLDVDYFPNCSGNLEIVVSKNQGLATDLKVPASLNSSGRPVAFIQSYVIAHSVNTLSNA